MPPESPPEISDLLNKPQVVATVHTPSDLEALETPSLAGQADLLEFRLDSLALPPSELAPRIAAAALPAILTARHPSEGGDGNLGPDERRALLEAHLDGAAALDVELRSVPEFGAFLSEIAAAGKLLILSTHDFDATPSPSELHAAIERAAAAGADIVKIATHLAKVSDLASLATLLEEEHPVPLSLMGMGPLGRVSRLLLAQSGSILNYGYLTQPNAPGQWPASRLKELIRELEQE